MSCLQCGRPNPPGVPACNFCGGLIEASDAEDADTTFTCTSCGRVGRTGSKFCDSCGSAFQPTTRLIAPRRSPGSPSHTGNRLALDRRTRSQDSEGANASATARGIPLKATLLAILIATLIGVATVAITLAPRKMAEVPEGDQRSSEDAPRINELTAEEHTRHVADAVRQLMQPGSADPAATFQSAVRACADYARLRGEEPLNKLLDDLMGRAEGDNRRARFAKDVLRFRQLGESSFKWIHARQDRDRLSTLVRAHNAISDGRSHEQLRQDGSLPQMERSMRAILTSFSEYLARHDEVSLEVFARDHCHFTYEGHEFRFKLLAWAHKHRESDEERSKVLLELGSLYR